MKNDTSTPCLAPSNSSDVVSVARSDAARTVGAGIAPPRVACFDIKRLDIEFFDVKWFSDMIRVVSPGPPSPPIGLRLTRTARAVSHTFEREMTQAGGSAATWQVLLLVRSGNWETQSKLAEQLGITGPTLTHHLNALERKGL